MAYLSTVLARSLSESWELMVGSPLVSALLAAGVFLGSLYFELRREGREKVKDTIRATRDTVIATLAVFLLVFLAHVVVITPARMHRELRDETARQVKESTSSTASVGAQLKELSGRLSDLEAEKKRTDTDNQVLRDKLADARDSRPLELKVPPGSLTRQVEPPKIEGLRFTSRRIPSAVKDAPYGLEITIQTDISTQPSRFLLYCDGPVAQTDWFAGMSSIAGVNTLPNDPKVVQADVTMPAIAPQNPLVVTLFSKDAVKVIGIKRVY